jgi:hypothetical protein
LDFRPASRIDAEVLDSIGDTCPECPPGID